MDTTDITCGLSVDWLNQDQSILKRVKLKTATLQLIRNEFREMYLGVEGTGVSLKLLLKSISVHRKFVAEGKATINFRENRIVLYISNAPASHLLMFLKVMSIKIQSAKCSPKVSLKEQLLSSKERVLQEISPIRSKDLNRMKLEVANKLKTNLLSSKKRKLIKEVAKIEAIKKKCLHNPVNEELTDEQKSVMMAVMKGGNIFFTGSAGTGKSFLLRKIMGALPPDVTMATASTGAAASVIAGTTLHSFAGVGNGDANINRCIELAQRPQVLQIWRRCKHLIIDEISMIDGKFFEKIEKVARTVRNSEKPFGGIQLILCGDFLQLPPVQKEGPVRFCFQTEAWANCRFQVFQLQKVHRQSDPEFVKMLDNIRMGRITAEITGKLLSTTARSLDKCGIIPTRLCCFTQEANLINTTKLQKLQGEEKMFDAEDSSPTARKVLDDQTPVEKLIILKTGAQVMLLKNINIGKGLVNGARGVVTNFYKDGSPVVQFITGQEYTVFREKFVVKTANGLIYSRKQIPIRLAWAFSIHKSQGLTLDCVEMSLSRVFEAGQAYVALSRAKSLDSLRIIDFDPNQVRANPDVLKFYAKQKRIMDTLEYIPMKNIRK